MGRDLTQEEVLKYSKIAGLILGIILLLGIGIHIFSDSRTIEVELSVGDSYNIVNVLPDEDIDMDETDGKLSYTITMQRPDGFTDFTVTAQEAGKVTLKVEDKAGNKYKYKIRISSER